MALRFATLNGDGAWWLYSWLGVAGAGTLCGRVGAVWVLNTVRRNLRGRVGRGFLLASSSCYEAVNATAGPPPPPFNAACCPMARGIPHVTWMYDTSYHAPQLRCALPSASSLGRGWRRIPYTAIPFFTLKSEWCPCPGSGLSRMRKTLPSGPPFQFQHPRWPHGEAAAGLPWSSRRGTSRWVVLVHARDVSWGEGRGGGGVHVAQGPRRLYDSAGCWLPVLLLLLSCCGHSIFTPHCTGTSISGRLVFEWQAS